MENPLLELQEYENLLEALKRQRASAGGRDAGIPEGSPHA